MTSRGTKYWANGSIPLIGPDILGNIISNLADLAVVISSEGRVLTVLANPIHRNWVDLDKWERGNIRDFLTKESIPKLEAALESYLEDDQVSRPIELNHLDTKRGWEFPINYTLHQIGPDDAILMLGRDLSPIAEMQQQLVKAQLALEQDYESQREYDTRFQVMLRNMRDAVVFVAVGTGRVTELNPAAVDLLGKPRDAVVGKAFARIFTGVTQTELIEQLSTASHSDGTGQVKLESWRTGRTLSLAPTLFRAAGERLLMCRIEALGNEVAAVDAYTRNLVALFEAGADAIVLTDQSGTITSSNEAFLNLVDAPDRQSVRGRLVSDFLVRGAVDQRLLMESGRSGARMRIYNTKVVGEYGGQRPVSVSATYLNDRTAPCFAFVLRDASLTEAVHAVDQPRTDDAQQINALVGSATLKDIVAQTTDVVEKMCIETAIELTGNNRVAAAEMLGLSRQSLYVKLRKFDMLSRDA